MTVKEAIAILKSLYPSHVGIITDNTFKIAKALRMAIEALSADAVPIHEDGTLEVKVPNAQKVGRVLVMDTDSHIGGGLFYPESADAVAVVRCKDCKASRVYGKTTRWLACEDVMEGQATDPNGYCYLGERREP